MGVAGIVERFAGATPGALASDVARLRALTGSLAGVPAHRASGVVPELALLARVAESRTHTRTAWARLLADHGATDVWLELTQQLPATDVKRASNLLDLARSRSLAATDLAKSMHPMPRPFLHANGPSTVLYKPPSSSYPSGHTLAAFAQARVLATLDPAHAADYAWMAREVGVARAYGGVHFLTDVRAGARLGVGIGEQLLRDMGIESMGGPGRAAFDDAVRSLDHLNAFTTEFGNDASRMVGFARTAVGGIEGAAITSRTEAIAALRQRYLPLGYDVLRQPPGSAHAAVPEVMLAAS